MQEGDFTPEQVSAVLAQMPVARIIEMYRARLRRGEEESEARCGVLDAIAGDHGWQPMKPMHEALASYVREATDIFDEEGWDGLLRAYYA